MKVEGSIHGLALVVEKDDKVFIFKSSPRASRSIQDSVPRYQKSEIPKRVGWMLHLPDTKSNVVTVI